MSQGLFKPWTFRLAVGGHDDLVHITMIAEYVADWHGDTVQERTSFCGIFFFARDVPYGTPVTCIECLCAVVDIHPDGTWLQMDYLETPKHVVDTEWLKR